MNKHVCHYCILLLFVGWLILLVGCQHAPSFYLEKAIEMEHISIDSTFFICNKSTVRRNYLLGNREIITSYLIKLLCGKQGNRWIRC